MKKKIIEMLVRCIKPHIRIMWGKEITSFDIILQVSLFDVVIANARYRPDHTSLFDIIVLREVEP